MSYFSNQKVFITGGSSGIGKALAVELAMDGAYVTLCSRDMAKLEQAKADIISATSCDINHISILSLDVTQENTVNQTISEYMTEFGTPDLLINSAGLSHPGEFLDLGMDKFHWLMDTNFFGTVHIIKAFLPDMIKRGSGHIVNISSAAGFLGVYGYTAYGATKYAVRGFSDALRAELLLKNITMSLVFPPDTDTPQLEYEAQFKPPITKILAGTAGVLSAQIVAKKILNGVRKRKYIIVPGTENAFLYHLSNFMGSKVYWIMDPMVRDAARKAKSK